MFHCVPSDGEADDDDGAARRQAAEEGAMRRFEGRTVLITGAGSGIGKATAQRFGAEGGRVHCVDVDGAAAEQTAAAIREAGGGEAAAAWCDVSDPTAVQRAV